MQRVRQGAGVSNGSLFHHFSTREKLVAGVLAEGLASHQRLLEQELSYASGAQHGVRRAVVAHLDWLTTHRELAELLLFTRADVLRAALDAEAIAASQAFFASLDTWLREQGWSGHPTLPILLAMWTGPTQEYARRCLAGQVGDPTGAAEDLAQGAWRALAPTLSIPKTS